MKWMHYIYIDCLKVIIIIKKHRYALLTYCFDSGWFEVEPPFCDRWGVCCCCGDWWRYWVCWCWCIANIWGLTECRWGIDFDESDSPFISATVTFSRWTSAVNASLRAITIPNYRQLKINRHLPKCCFINSFLCSAQKSCRKSLKGQLQIYEINQLYS